MIRALRRRAAIYAALAATVPKLFLAYSLWFWIGILLNVIMMMVFVYFWRAVYAGTATIAGLTLAHTLGYILLARIFAPLADMNVFWDIGYSLREGGIAHLLLRPLDLQASHYVASLAATLTDLVWQAPLAVVATLAFGLRWPTDPAVWGAFLLTVALGRTIMFFLDWSLAGVTFYTTEVWGLGVLMGGVGLFLSGSLVPLDMMPGWLQVVVQAFPFAQAVYVPISILSGITPLAEVPRLVAVQLIWLAGLGLASRAFFNVALRKVTVQGG